MNDNIQLKTLQYNIFSRWINVTDYEGQNKRISQIPESIYNHSELGKNIDVITIIEAWCPIPNILANKILCNNNNLRNKLTKNMKKYGWKYHSILSNKQSSLMKQGGNGIIIYSRFPIKKELFYIFKNCSNLDCFASKGASYIQIVKNNIKINIIGTHLQNSKNCKIQLKQLKEIQTNFIPKLNLSNNKSEVLLYQGDLNLDIDKSKEITKILNAKIPKLIGKEKYTINNKNYLVGKDGDASIDGCFTEYKQKFKKITSFSKFSSKSICSCCSNKLYDYILYSNNKLLKQPIKSNIKIIPLKSKKRIVHKFGLNKDGINNLFNDENKNNYIHGYELSDHYPILGNFTFKL